MQTSSQVEPQIVMEDLARASRMMSTFFKVVSASSTRVCYFDKQKKVPT